MKTGEFSQGETSDLLDIQRKKFSIIHLGGNRWFWNDQKNVNAKGKKNWRWLNLLNVNLYMDAWLVKMMKVTLKKFKRQMDFLW